MRRMRGQFGFMYKFMDESMGPNKDQPSQEVLSSLTPLPSGLPEYDESARWRARAWEHLGNRLGSDLRNE